VTDAVASTKATCASISDAYLDRARPGREFERAHHAPGIEGQWPLPTVTASCCSSARGAQGAPARRAPPRSCRFRWMRNPPSSTTSNNEMTFSQGAISQGGMSVSADQAQATGSRRFEFRGQPLGVPRQREDCDGPGTARLRRGRRHLREEAALQGGRHRQAGGLRAAQSRRPASPRTATPTPSITMSPRARCGCRRTPGSATARTRFAASR
jgi:hypothetical protein